MAATGYRAMAYPRQNVSLVQHTVFEFVFESGEREEKDLRASLLEVVEVLEMCPFVGFQLLVVERVRSLMVGIAV